MHKLMNLKHIKLSVGKPLTCRQVTVLTAEASEYLNSYHWSHAQEHVLEVQHGCEQRNRFQIPILEYQQQ
jgi:hypothetical protein